MTQTSLSSIRRLLMALPQLVMCRPLVKAMRDPSGDAECTKALSRSGAATPPINETVQAVTTVDLMEVARMLVPSGSQAAGNHASAVDKAAGLGSKCDSPVLISRIWIPARSP